MSYVAPHKIMCTVTAEGLKQDGRTDVRRGLLFHYGRRARTRSVSAKEVPPPVHSPPAISFFTGGYPFLCRLRAVLSGSTSYHITSTSKPCYTASCACIVALPVRLWRLTR